MNQKKDTKEYKKYNQIATLSHNENHSDENSNY